MADFGFVPVSCRHSCTRTWNLHNLKTLKVPPDSRRNNKKSDWKMNNNSEIAKGFFLFCFFFACVKLSLAALWNFISSVFLLCPAAAGPGGPGAQRFPSSVCLWEVEGTADPDGGPRLWDPDGDGGHRACQAAPGVPAGVLITSSQTSLSSVTYPSPFLKMYSRGLKCPECELLHETFLYSTYRILCLIYVSGLALSALISFDPVSVFCVSFIFITVGSV